MLFWKHLHLLRKQDFYKTCIETGCFFMVVYKLGAILFNLSNSKMKILRFGLFSLLWFMVLMAYHNREANKKTQSWI